MTTPESITASSPPPVPAAALPGPLPAPEPQDHEYTLVGSSFAFTLYFALCYAGARFLSPHHIGTGPVLSFLIFSVVCYGLSAIIVDSAIAWPFSKLANKIPVIGPSLYTNNEQTGKESGLLSCSLCSGMWIGTIMAILGISIFPISAGLLGMRDLVCHGLVSAAMSYAIHVVLDRIKNES